MTNSHLTKIAAWVFYLFLLVAALTVTVSAQKEKQQKNSQDQQSMRAEEEEDYFRKWLEQDVLYIISDQEKAVFQGLSTLEEKEQFIEQFWYRRDPDLRTPANEFKEEHYRRIAYANERFQSGRPGWMSDRGRIYIIHGEPAEIEAHPTGGTYVRPNYEGGGTTSTYPFEVWRYRYLEGIGDDIELEFVDKTMSGEYRLALNPEEKDALLYMPGGGLTLLEEMGEVSKSDRRYFNPGGGYDNYSRRAKDNPFTRYETHVMVQAPQQIKYKDLKEIVEVGISYDTLPFEVREDYIKLNEDRVLTPITLEVRNKNLTFNFENGVHVANLAVYGIVTSISNRVITEFEDDLVAAYSPDSIQRGLEGRSLYQKVVPLKPRVRYKLDLIVKDLNGESMGVLRKALVPPALGTELEASSLILSDHIQMLEETPKDDQMFVIGDVWIRPRVDKTFLSGKALGVYLQVHNASLDQATGAPSLTVRYALRRGDKPAVEQIDRTGESVQFYSGQRVVLIRILPLKDVEPGDYRVDVEVKDNITNQTLAVNDRVKILPE
jgi:GWxTD domain-containing protein